MGWTRSLSSSSSSEEIESNPLPPTSGRSATGIRRTQGPHSAESTEEQARVWRFCGLTIVWTRKRRLAAYFGAGLVIFGTSSQLTLASIFNSQSIPCPDCERGAFEGQLILSLAEAIGMTLLLAIYHADGYISRCLLHRESGGLERIGFGPTGERRPDDNIEKDSRTVSPAPSIPAASVYRQPPWYLWILPGLADCTANLLFFYAASKMSLTQVNIMKPFRLLIIAAVSMAYFEREIRIHCFVGIFLFIIAQILATVDEAILIKKAKSFIKGEGELMKGTTLCIFGVLCLAFEIFLFECMAEKYFVNPLRGLGLIGVVGLVATASAMVLCELTKFREMSRGWYQIRHSRRLLYGIISEVISVNLMNLLSLILTTLVTSLFTSTVLALRIIPVYIVEVLMGWLSFTILGCTAVLVCIMGVLVYSGIPLSWLREDSLLYRFLRARLHFICRVRKYESPFEDEAQSSIMRSRASLALESLEIKRLGIQQSTISRKVSSLLVNPWIMIEKLSDRLSPRL